MKIVTFREEGYKDRFVCLDLVYFKNILYFGISVHMVVDFERGQAV